MEQPEQNVVAQTQTALPKPAALQDTRPSDAAVSDTPGAAVFESKNVSSTTARSAPSRTYR